MTQKQTQIVKSTWIQVAAIDPVIAGGLFYNRLFEIAPQLRPMFGNSLEEQSKKLLAMIGYVIAKLDKLETILSEVTKLARRHTAYGVKPDHYTVVGSALLWTLEKALGEAWNEQTNEAWTACYTLLSSAMITATEEEQQAAA